MGNRVAFLERELILLLHPYPHYTHNIVSFQRVLRDVKNWQTLRADISREAEIVLSNDVTQIIRQIQKIYTVADKKSLERKN